jgi:predicted N-formylglutamate amidohydrolase
MNMMRRAFLSHPCVGWLRKGPNWAKLTSLPQRHALAPSQSRFSSSSAPSNLNNKAVHLLRPAEPSALPYRLLLTCEHASQLLPLPWRWPDEDRRLLNTHWALDLGSEELTRELSVAVAAPAAIAQFTRLLVDANRPLHSSTLFRDTADGIPVFLNKELTPEEKENRLEKCYYPYHRALAALQKEVMPDFILSLHSYTKNYEGQPRKVEVGVLYKEDEELAKAMKKQFTENGGYDCRMNEPWSGLEGFMYSADRHGHWDEDAFKPPQERSPGWTEKEGKSDIAVIMLEMRNDLLTDKSWRAAFTQRLTKILGSSEVVDLVKKKKASWAGS